MTGRTHDLTALTALNFAIISQPIPQITLGTAILALSAGFIGGLAPDLDQPTANLWRRLPLGPFFGSLIAPIMGRHRFISHSLVGIFIFGIIAKILLNWMSTFVIVDIDIVWNAFLIGFISHLIADSVTHDGVPWLFPIPINFGFPPLQALRIKTGGFLEKYVIFPSLLGLNFYLFFNNHQLYKELIQKLI